MTPPVGGRAPIRRVGIFTAAALAGGAVTGTLAYLLGALVRASPAGPVILAAAALTAAAFLASATLLGRSPATLSGTWVVPRSWGTYGPGAFAALFGVHLGLGWRTRIGSNLFWLLMAGAALAPTLHLAVLPFLAFATTRALPILVTATVRSTVTRHYSVKLTVSDARLLGAAARSPYARYASVLSAVAFGVAVYATAL